MEKETARIEAFSDGVFAIAITLLVLDLHVPTGEQYFNKTALLQKLAKDWPSYLAFGLSFFSVFIMWVNHHKLFRQIYHRTTAITFANGLLLFLASIVPWPTALLARYYHTPAASVTVSLYTGLFVLINLSFNLIWHLASRDRALLRPGITEQTIARIRRNYLYGVPVHLLAFLLSFFLPTVALALCVLLWTYWAFTSGRVTSNNTSIEEGHSA